jgi:HicB family
MKERTYEALSNLRVRPELHRRVKTAASREGLSILDFVEEIIEPALQAKEGQTTRHRSQERPTRTRPVE